jgi:hypothetical protein
MSAAEGRQVIKRLRKAIGCPISWEDPEAPEDPEEHDLSECMCKDLRLYWVQIAQKYETDGETMYYSRKQVEWSLYEPDLKVIEKNYPSWRDNAVDEYEEKTGFLRKLKFASQAEQNKHYPNPTWLESKIIHKTIRGDALFFKKFDRTELDRCLWWSIEQRLVEVIENRPAHLYFQHVDDVGASKGEMTKLIRFDIDYNTPIAHGHPILAKELPSHADVITEPRYAFPADVYDDFDHDIDEQDDESITPRRDDPMP